jgi:hypothetical protein
MSTNPSSHASVADETDPGEQAMRCRRLARTVTDQRTLEVLAAMASEYEARARGRETCQSGAVHQS